MSWLHPTYIWALVAVPVAIFFFRHAMRRRRQARQRLGYSTLIKQLTPTASPRRQRYKAALVSGAVLLLAAALIGPRYGTKLRTVERQGIDLLIALDVSRSMQAEDVAPSRLKRAKKEIKDLLKELRGDRVGLIVFAGDAFLQCPLTTDYSAVRMFLDVADPSLLGTPGTNFRAVYDAADRAFNANAQGSEPVQEHSKALLFVSDGENHEAGASRIAQQARQRNIALFTAGVGTKEGGPIPLYDEGRRAGYKRDEQGEIVTTRLEQDMLQELSGEDRYFRIARTASTLSNLPDVLGQMQQASFGAEKFEEYSEQYQWPLALALLLLLAEPLIRSRRPSENATGL